MTSVLYIFWIRQLKRHFRVKARIVGTLGQPLLLLVALGFGLGPTVERAQNIDFLQYLVPGVVTLSVLFTGMMAGMGLIWDRRFGFLKETMVAPIPRWWILTGKALGGATVAMAQGFIVFGLSFLFGFRLESFAWLPVAFILLFLIALLFTAFGLAVAANLEDMQSFPVIINFVIFPIFFLSGAVFPLNDIPQWLSVVTRFNPLTYGVDGLRATMINQQTFSLLTDFAILVPLTLLVIALGTYFFQRIRI